MKGSGRRRHCRPRLRPDDCAELLIWTPGVARLFSSPSNTRRISFLKHLMNLARFPCAVSACHSPPAWGISARLPWNRPRKWIITQLLRTMDVYVSPSGRRHRRRLHGVQGIVKKMDLPSNGLASPSAKLCPGHAAVISQFRAGAHPFPRCSFISFSSRNSVFLDPLLILWPCHRSYRRAAYPLSHRHHPECDVAHGRSDDGGHRYFQQHPHRGIYRRLREEGRPLREAVSLACRVRLRPVLMTSLATLIGLIPMAMKLGTGSEAYAPLARAIIGGLQCPSCSPYSSCRAPISSFTVEMKKLPDKGIWFQPIEE